MEKRTRLGRGMEHEVWTTKHKFKIGEVVLKKPHPYITLTMSPTENPLEVVRNELKEAQLDAEQFGVKIPRTRAIYSPSKAGYILVQERLTHDNSIKDIGKFLEEKGATFLRDRYDAKPDNFMSVDGTVYLIDFTKGPFRITNILDPDNNQTGRVRKIRQMLRKIKRFITRS